MNREQFLNYLTLDGWVGCADDEGPGIKKPDGGECYWDSVGLTGVLYAPTYGLESPIAYAYSNLADLPEKFLRAIAEKMEVDYEP